MTTATNPGATPDQSSTQTTDALIEEFEATEAATAAEEQSKEAELHKELSFSELEGKDAAELEKMLGEGSSFGLIREIKTDTKAPAPEPSKETTTQEEGQATEEAGETEGDETAEAGKKATMIPKPRLDAVLAENKRLAEELAKQKETNAFLAGKEAASKPNAQPQPDPIVDLRGKYQRLQEGVDTRIDRIWEKVDNAEITNVEARRLERKVLSDAALVRRGLDAEKQRLEQARNAPSPEQVAREIDEDPILEAKTAKLVEANPWLDTMPEEIFNSLVELAINRLEKNGQVVTQDAAGTWRIRQEIVKVGAEHGYNKLFTNGFGGNPKPVDKDPSRLASSEQLREKTKLAATHPPATKQGGVNASTNIVQAHGITNSTSFEELERVSTDVLEKLAMG